MLVAVLLLVVSPLAAAGDPVIKRGIDVFNTLPNGKTFYDFAKSPIPAGFLCKGSPALTGRVALRGLPLQTEIAGQLRSADTIVERLDDAAFDANGLAVTRIKFRALSMVSMAPIRTSCGSFHVYVTLAEKQRTTTMRIYRTSERGGNFHAPLSIVTRISFVPTKGESLRRLEIQGIVNFPGKAIPWSFADNSDMKKIAGSVFVDTNGDLTPDTRLPSTSNFASGWPSDGFKVATAQAGGSGDCSPCGPEVCHDADGEQHCTGGMVCYPDMCY